MRSQRNWRGSEVIPGRLLPRHVRRTYPYMAFIMMIITLGECLSRLDLAALPRP